MYRHGSRGPGRERGLVLKDRNLRSPRDEYKINCPFPKTFCTGKRDLGTSKLSYRGANIVSVDDSFRVSDSTSRSTKSVIVLGVHNPEGLRVPPVLNLFVNFCKKNLEKGY